MKTLVHSWNLSINHWLRFKRQAECLVGPSLVLVCLTKQSKTIPCHSAVFPIKPLRIHPGEAFLFLKEKKFRISLAESRKVTTFVATPIAHEGLEGQILLEKGR